jgi:WD40 repeat protein
MAKADHFQTAIAPPDIPDHEMLRCIGQGSYGEVWLARNAVGTFRAVKVVHRARFLEARPYEREFEGIQKYEPISRTNDGLVDVLQIGRNDDAGSFYYIMELADDAAGQQTPSVAAYIPKTLARQIQTRGRLPYEECLTLGLTLNLALGHLHRHGLMHRDVKPSNIIFVNGVPKLADIGLVTGLDEGRSFVGTEGFIPPEGPNSPQADLYALGKVLYEAGMGKDRQEFPEPFTRLGLDDESKMLMELNTVLLRACAPKLAERYQSAEEMNADLALLHSGRSVRQRHALERRLKWATRLGVALAAVMVLGAAPYYWAIKEAHAAKLAEADAKEKLWGAYLAQAQAGRFSHRQGERFHGLELLRKAAEMRPALELRNEAIACMILPDLRAVREWNGLLDPTTAVDFDFQHDRYVRCETGGQLSVRSLTDDREQFRLPAWRDSGLTHFGFGPEGRWLAAAYTNHCFTVWDMWQRRPALNWTPFLFRSFDFDDAGRLIAVAQYRGPILVYDLAGGRDLAAIAVTNLPYSIRFDPGGRRLAVSFTDSPEAKIFDLATGKLEQSCLFPGPLYHVAWHPDGTSLAAGSVDGRIFIWEVASKTVKTALVGHQAEVVNVMFLDEGNWLGSASWDGTFRLWDLFAQREILSVPMADTGLRMSRDVMMAGYWNPSTRKIGTLELAAGHEMRQIHPTDSPDALVVGSAFDPAGKFFATSYRDGVRLWNLATGKQLAYLPIGWTCSPQFTQGGEALLTGTKAGLQERTLQVHSETNVILGEPRVLGPPGLVTQVSASRDGRLAYLQDGELHLYDLRTHSEQTPLTTGGRHARLTLSWDGKWLALWGRPPKEFQIWQLATGRMVRSLGGYQGDGYAQFSPDGVSLAIGGYDGYQVWKTGQWTCAYSVPRTGMVVREFAFSPDSRLLAVAHSETVVQLLDAVTGREVATLEPPEPRVVSWVGFSPNGGKLAVTCNSQLTQIWDLGLIRRELAGLKLDWP